MFYNENHVIEDAICRGLPKGNGCFRPGENLLLLFLIK